MIIYPYFTPQEALAALTPEEQRRYVGIEWRGGWCRTLLAPFTRRALAVGALALALATPTLAAGSPSACRWTDTNPPQRVRLTAKGAARPCYLETRLVFRPTKNGEPWEVRTASVDRCAVWVGDAKRAAEAVQACQDATLRAAEADLAERKP